MADWLTDLNNKQKDQAGALAEARGSSRPRSASWRRLNRALERIPDLKTQAVNAATRIEALNDELQVVEAQLARRAQEIVEDRHKLPFWKKGLKVLATIAKAIPVGQPVVGGLGTSLDVVLNFDSDKPWKPSSPS